MAEEQTEQTNQNDLDLAKVQDFIRGQVETFAKEAFDKHAADLPTTQPAVRQTREEAARQQLRSVLEPFIKPEIDTIRVEAADTRDYVQFYDSNSGVDTSDREAVEKMFLELKQKGRPIARQDIYDYLQGKKAREKPEEFTKSMNERRKQQTERASSAADVGLAALDRARNDPVWSNVRNMPLADLEKALEGVTF
jgi:hypothetical protein